ncbi:PepSY-associated TM helix domain-containing protein [Herbaspirillum sp. alder98]|uniref:PepSY-associated TM helix domain-containing protein n=1 Tax=Herbaspirillum sp. alder98 TaxID=2913096 RepID=UPI001CD8DC76|nr:PepSY-associated TM helix domain-containing protein [Herbaspirillum sp. alder98]MCA1326105.1 PepSY domain-containing protein [Herbaspirillum sp. alder98]
MSWLHTWCGLTCGWLLCAIFVAGTLSVFREPITRWMEARPALDATGADAPALVATAVRYLGTNAADARSWIITLPEQSGDALLLSWRTKVGPQQAALDPADGAVLPTPWGRATEGGRHFMAFHYMLHAGIPGFWVVGWIAMCALVALISGVVVHKRIFSDFFTFRPGKGQRSWLDAHNVSAVLALPFLFMIVYTGLTYFYSSYLPLPLQVVYGRDAKAYQRFEADLARAAMAPDATPRIKDAAAPIPDLLQQAIALTGADVQRIVVERPLQENMVVRLLGAKQEHDPEAILALSGMLVYDHAGGKFRQVTRAGAPAHFGAEHVHGVLERLHVAGFGGWGIKWLYFICGLMGCVMIATGTLLFSVKRQKKSMMEFGRCTAVVYRCVEVLNVTAVMGICVACIGFLYANRLIPADFVGRQLLEIQAFFAIWMACLLHAAWRPASRAWNEQLVAAGLLCLGLPLLNWASTGQHLLHYAQRGDWQRGGVELTSLLLGCLFILIWRKR